MASDRGVFPGQWALPGGGVEAGERIEDALRREVREELGVDVTSFSPLLFKDAILNKTYADGTTSPLHMVFLIYRCTLSSQEIVLNEEFSEYRWLTSHELATVELSSLTRETLMSAGLLG